MSTINYPTDRHPVSKLRNGTVKTAAIAIVDAETSDNQDDAILLQPITSKGEPASGFIAVPRDAETIAALIRELRAVHRTVSDQEDREHWRAGRAGWVRAAAEHYARDGELEIDDDATVSEGADDGVYVQAWLWVSQSEAVPPDTSLPLNWIEAHKQADAEPGSVLFLAAAGVFNADDEQEGDTFSILVCAPTHREAEVAASRLAAQSVPLCQAMHLKVLSVQAVPSAPQAAA